jgi:hypothetical protein
MRPPESGRYASYFMQGYSIIYADHSTTTIRGAAQGVASLSPGTSCWLKFPHSALHFHIRKCFRARKCHRGREYYSTQRKSNLPGREWNSAHQGDRQRDSRRPQETGRRRMAQTGSSRNECGNGRLREPRSLWDSKNFAITEL